MSELKCGWAPETASVIQNLSVGQILRLRCEGEWLGWAESQSLDLAKWQIRYDGSENDPYLLKVLAAHPSAEASKVYDLELVSYRVGQHQLKAVQMLSDEASVVLGDLSFQVKTVQKEDEPVTEPFGPFGPLGAPWPWLTIALICLVLVSALALILTPILRRRKYARWMRELPPLRFAAPEQELYKLMRAQVGVAQLSQGCRIFLARKFEVPVHKLPRTKSLALIEKKLEGRGDELFNLIQELLIEFERLQGTQELSDTESKSILVRLHRLIDLIGVLESKRGKA